MLPARSMVTVRPLFDSSGRDCAFGSEMSTPPCIIGAVIMKMIISSIITSMRLTTLISALRGSRSRPRPRRAISSLSRKYCRRSSDHALSHHQRDKLRCNALQLAFDLVEPGREDVVREHCRNRYAQGRRGCNERLRNSRRYRADIPRALGCDTYERVYYPQHRAKEPDQRTHRANRRQRRNPPAESVALGAGLGVEDELERFDLRAAEARRPFRSAVQRRSRLLNEAGRPLHDRRRWTSFVTTELC